MITTDTTNELGATVAKDLRTVMQGKVAIAGEASYEGARRVFNGAVDRRPALFAFCESARDVQEAVRAARAYGLPLSVRGGGHDWVGRTLNDHGLVVDLSRMRQVDVDVRGRIATVAGGARAIDVIAAAESNLIFRSFHRHVLRYNGRGKVVKIVRAPQLPHFEYTATGVQGLPPHSPSGSKQSRRGRQQNKRLPRNHKLRPYWSSTCFRIGAIVITLAAWGPASVFSAQGELARTSVW